MFAQVIYFTNKPDKEFEKRVRGAFDGHYWSKNALVDFNVVGNPDYVRPELLVQYNISGALVADVTLRDAKTIRRFREDPVREIYRFMAKAMRQSRGKGKAIPTRKAGKYGGTSEEKEEAHALA
jgi:hypothetical protein